MAKNCQKSNTELSEKIRTPVSVLTPGLEQDWKNSSIGSLSVDSSTLDPDEVKTPTFVPEGTPPQLQEIPTMSTSETCPPTSMKIGAVTCQECNSYDQNILYVDPPAQDMEQKELCLDLTPRICTSLPTVPISYTDLEMDADEDPTSSDSESCGLSSIVSVLFLALSVVVGKIVAPFNWGVEKYYWFVKKYSGVNMIFKAFLLGVHFYTTGVQIEVWLSADLLVAQMENDGPDPWYDCSFCAGLTMNAIVIARNIVERVQGEGAENADFKVGGTCKTFGGKSANGLAFHTKEGGYYTFGANSHPFPRAFMIVSVNALAVLQLIFWVLDDLAPWLNEFNGECIAPNQLDWRRTLADYVQTHNERLSAQSHLHKLIFTKERIDFVVYMIHFVLYLTFYCPLTLAIATQISQHGCWGTKGFFPPVWLLCSVYVFMGIVGALIVAFILLVIVHHSCRSRPEYRFWLSFSAQCLIMFAVVIVCIVGGIGMINTVVDNPLYNIPSLLYAFCIFAFQVKNAVSARRDIVEFSEDTSAPAENESEVATPAVHNESAIASVAEQTRL